MPTPRTVLIDHDLLSRLPSNTYHHLLAGSRPGTVEQANIHVPERVVLTGDAYANLCAEASVSDDRAARIADLELATEEMADIIADLLPAHEAAAYLAETE